MLLWAGFRCLVYMLNGLYVHTPVLTCFLNHTCLVAVFLKLTHTVVLHLAALL